ncbi:hypothetical protein [Cellulomonas sp. IC4_254]|uniref:hypothetical protein n=1 Tax=Cellulomonas sp. IC4_254 TaxID=2714040 RepID=UPI00196BA8EF|nr:hypothetical protein [Cellulomonas sp. IC4_254]
MPATPTAAALAALLALTAGTPDHVETAPSPAFDWNWTYPAPTCDGITVTFPEDLPESQTGVLEITVRTSLGTLQYKLEGDAYRAAYPGGHAGATVVVPWSEFRGADLTGAGAWEITWVQVHGTNVHWEGSVLCGSTPAPEPEPEPEPSPEPEPEPSPEPEPEPSPAPGPSPEPAPVEPGDTLEPGGPGSGASTPQGGSASVHAAPRTASEAAGDPTTSAALAAPAAGALATTGARPAPLALAAGTLLAVGAAVRGWASRQRPAQH